METDREAMRKRVLIALGGVVAVLAIVLGIVVITHKDSSPATTTTTTSSSTSTSTTSTSTTSTTLAPTTTVPAADLDDAVFPDLTSGTRYPDPVAMTRDFALQVLGFDDSAVIGGYESSGPHSGSVGIAPDATSPVTRVLVRQVADGSWIALGTRADSIRLDTPIAHTRISSPQPLIGAAYAFEGRVNVMLYADGSDTPIATSFVMGRGDGVLGDFSSQLSFTVPAGVTRGVLVLSASGAKDGTTVAAATIRVAF